MTLSDNLDRIDTRSLNLGTLISELGSIEASLGSKLSTLEWDVQEHDKPVREVKAELSMSAATCDLMLAKLDGAVLAARRLRDEISKTQNELDTAARKSVV